MRIKVNMSILNFHYYRIRGLKSYERVVLESVIRAIYYYVSFQGKRSIPGELLLHYQNWLSGDRQSQSVKAPVTSVDNFSPQHY
ncbi:hypothetical protein H6F77_09720 [Microcoleus sp. FACHB-831]|nr:hypothetical protein [Microcoleus sp. FACHB-831]